jgi:hypothetical protein
MKIKTLTVMSGQEKVMKGIKDATGNKFISLAKLEISFPIMHIVSTDQEDTVEHWAWRG